MDGFETFLVIFVVILVLAIIGCAIWFWYEKDLVDQCHSEENILCPVIYCPPIEETGEPGSRCFNKENQTQPAKVAAFRYPDPKNINDIQCQNYTVNHNVVATVKQNAFSTLFYANQTK